MEEILFEHIDLILLNILYWRKQEKYSDSYGWM